MLKQDNEFQKDWQKELVISNPVWHFTNNEFSSFWRRIPGLGCFCAITCRYTQGGIKKGILVSIYFLSYMVFTNAHNVVLHHFSRLVSSLIVLRVSLALCWTITGRFKNAKLVPKSPSHHSSHIMDFFRFFKDESTNNEGLVADNISKFTMEGHSNTAIDDNYRRSWNNLLDSAG